MPTLPAESIDMVFADPPYNLQLPRDLWRPNLTRVDAVKETWDQFNNYSDYDAFTRQWILECRRLLKPEGTFWVIGTYHNIHRIGAILQDLDFWILNDIVWIKTNPMPNFHGMRFTNAHEILIWAQKQRDAKTSYNHMTIKALNDDLQMRSDWLLPICCGKERIKKDGKKAHPTQKPEALLYRILMASTRPDDIVLDPFFGTGTSGVVARHLHRHWIGIEKNPDYVELASERIDTIHQAEFDPLLFNLTEKRRRPRIPFGSLLENGLLMPGQILFLGGKKGKTATVHSDGTIHCDKLHGSIHMVARQILQAPCNGWEEWLYEDPVSGEMRSINELRLELYALLDEEKGNVAVSGS
ncbi:MAG: DNA methyltransferase [Anaerolineaceae bacterium]